MLSSNSRERNSSKFSLKRKRNTTRLYNRFSLKLYVLNAEKERERERIMLFYSFFKTLVGKQITVELKNDLEIRGTLVSVDQYLNIKLESVSVLDEEKYPHMKSVRDCFVRGSVVRYVQPPEESVDVYILHDATRREARSAV